MDNLKIKEKLKQLIGDFKSRYSYYKSLSEPNIETKLIEELFINVLGWNKNDFLQQEKVRRGDKRGRADYGFYLNERLVFFLEVKKVGIPLDKEADKQVISYALSKKVPFAISTNFEQMKIFCVESAEEGKNIFRVFNKSEDYLERFNDLLLLSKESFQEGKLLQVAIDEERLKKRVSIDKVLLEDLISIRKLIADDIEKNYPQKYDINDKEEIVQRIIDRLIFIRRCEDIGINPNDVYLEQVRQEPDDKAYPKLKEIFEKYNSTYNSGLFAIQKDNDCDIIRINGFIIKRLISYLYESKDKKYVYNFSWIDADVLGQVYEQYLGNILQLTKSGKAKLKSGQSHKKEQGIYYTPTYIVDYIVKETLLPLSKDKKLNLKEIKILDPACGSGSFLIKAFDYLYKELSKIDETKQTKFDNQGIYSIKTDMLKKNIYGVDLDNQAVEITKLNLLLKASEKWRKLPEEIDLHIRRGNSLVNDEEIDKNYFEWKDDFEEGGFDVIIGNPPYIDSEEMVKSQPEVREYCNKKYLTAKGNWDIFLLFIEKGLKLLKEGGYLGMIVPNKLLSASYAKEIRRHIQNYKIIAIRDYSKIPVFRASVYPIVIIIKKEKSKSNSFTAELMEPQGDDVKIGFSQKIKQEDLQKNKETWAHIFSEFGTELIGKILNNSINLSDIANVSGAATVSEAYELKKIIQDLNAQQNYFKFINTGTIDKYISLWGVYDTKYIKDSYKKPIIKREDLKKFSSKRFNEALGNKIIIAGMNKELECYLDDGEYLAGKSTTIITSNKINLKVLLAILNSKLMTYIYKNLFKSLSLAGGYMRIGSPQIKNLPIKIPSEQKQKVIIQITDRMIDYNKSLSKLGNKTTSETNLLNEKIKNLDKEINDIIYEVYGINNKERDIIEN